MTTKIALQKEVKYFEKKKKDLLKKNKGAFALIKDSELIGTFPTEENAYKEGIQLFGNAPFLIKQILAKENNISFSSLYFGVKDANL